MLTDIHHLLPTTLSEIVTRFARDSDYRIAALAQFLNSWTRGDVNRSAALEEWGKLTDQIFAGRHWMALLFPDFAVAPSEAPRAAWRDGERLQSERGLAATLARTTWITAHANLQNREGLMSTLLRDLRDGTPSEGAAFSFLSRYCTFIDLLVARFVEPELQPVHERIFETLHLQREHWRHNYCNGYLYQGWEELGLCGVKPTAARLQRYRVADYLRATDRVLDLGANNCFLSLAVGRMVRHVDAVELNPFLVDIGRTAGARVGQSNVQFVIADIEYWHANDTYDVLFSLANHSTIDTRMSMNFEFYAAKLFSLLRPGGLLFFESHNVFGPGLGGPGDDGDLDLKFDILEQYFEVVEYAMNPAFVPAHDVDKLFVLLKRRVSYVPGVKRAFSLAVALGA